MTIYAVGLENDKTLRRFIAHASERGECVQLVNLHAVVREPWRFVLPASPESAMVYGEKDSLTLDPSASYYVRTVDLSPVLSQVQASAWRCMLAALTAFLEAAPGRVVNRPGAHSHNGAKPLHEWWLARQGLRVPPSITTSSREELQAFVAAHGSCVVKALSGMRGSAQLVSAASFDGYRPAQGPVHAQRRVAGYDVRVHVVGTASHAERIDCDEVDYREKGVDARHTPIRIPEPLERRIVEASQRMGLAFTGWDFKVDAQGEYWCLEANPMPGYDVYDRRAGGAISDSILSYLSGKSH